jgi:hypothetical protein
MSSSAISNNGRVLKVRKLAPPVDNHSVCRKKKLGVGEMKLGLDILKDIMI